MVITNCKIKTMKTMP